MFKIFWKHNARCSVPSIHTLFEGLIFALALPLHKTTGGYFQLLLGNIEKKE